MFTRGRLVPRQPRAIKRTTRTELRDEIIVKVTWLIVKGEIVKGKQSLTPSPLLSSFRRLHEQRPMVLRRERGVVTLWNRGAYFGINLGWWCYCSLMVKQFAAFHRVKYGKSCDHLTLIMRSFASNHFTFYATSSYKNHRCTSLMRIGGLFFPLKCWAEVVY